MPELPEVETIRRELAPALVGRTLDPAWAFPHPKFLPALDAAGAMVVDVERRGKYLVVKLHDQHELIVHLGMTGSLRIADGAEDPVAPDGQPSDPYVRAWWTLDGDGVGAADRLEYRDVRRFGRLAVVEAGRYQGTLAVQGPDALDPSLTPEDLWRSLRASRRAVKTQLLSQRPVAGVGNIYADEALWLARIHPRRRRVSRQQAADLLEAVREVLTTALGNGGTTLRDYRTFTGAEGRNQRHLACYEPVSPACAVARCFAARSWTAAPPRGALCANPADPDGVPTERNWHWKRRVAHVSVPISSTGSAPHGPSTHDPEPGTTRPDS
jgi:formamidopyrimidine-DNA glycosylase